jgi:AraC family transcriptional regulator, transcriptional activator of pobA
MVAPPVIPQFPLTERYFDIHKEGPSESNFGLDNAPSGLIDGGFGLYSSARVRAQIGPLKSQFYRVALCLRGEVTVECGLETYRHQRYTLHFNFPGQIFSLHDKTADMAAYYALFTADFMDELLPAARISAQFPFLDYGGEAFFQLTDTEGANVERTFEAMNEEVQTRGLDFVRVLKTHLYQLLLTGKRAYARHGLLTTEAALLRPDIGLVARFKRLINEHFRNERTLATYASRLAVSPKHLARVVKEQTGRTPAELLDDLLLLEARALLRYTDTTVAEIAYELHFTDPSHFGKFFRKHIGQTPGGYRAGDGGSEPKAA